MSFILAPLLRLCNRRTGAATSAQKENEVPSELQSVRSGLAWSCQCGRVPSTEIETPQTEV
jgi:hypothetical protein